MGFKNKVISIVLTLSMALSVPMCAYAEGQSAPGPEGEAPATSAQSAPSAQKALEPAEDAHDEAPAPSAEEQAQAGIAVAREEVAEVSYVLIARPEMTTSDDQLIVVGFSDDTRVAESATLELVDEATGDALSVELDNAVAGALLFKVAGADLGEGAYRIASLEFAESDAREAKKVSFREDAQNVYRFFVETDLGQGADAAEGDAVRAFTLNDEGALEARDSVSAALDAAAGVQVLSTAADPASARDGDLVVALDAGHGGRDGGAQGDGLSEKDLTLKIAKYCKAELERYSGVRVVMTRSGDFYVGLSERVRYAVSQGADVFVSLHINSSTNSSAHGAEVIIPNDSSYLYEEVHVAGKELAEKILAQITGLGLTERDIYWSDSTSGETFPDGSIADYFTVIDEAHWAGIPGIIVEHAFVSNPKDAAFLGNEDNLRALGVADAKGIAAQYGLGVGKWVLGEDGRWRWYEGSTMVTNAWRTIGGDTLWFGADGIAVRGWFEIGEKKYYFSPESAALQRGWLDLNGKRYRLDRDDGHLWTGFYTVDGIYYYSDSDGAMRRGWLDHDGKRYRLDRDDGHLWTGWYTVDGKWYYSNDEGVLMTGWVLDGAYYHYYGKGETFFPYKSQELYYVSGSRYASADSLIAAFKASGARYPAAELARGGAGSVGEFCRIVYEESVAEGIRPQVVFCQAMLETGWLRFGGDVSIGQFNFAGLGAVGSGAAGASFPDVRTGIRAQVQHLKAYANNEPLNNACVDPRFSYVTRGVSEYVQWLGIPNNPTGKGWAATDGYGMNIASMIEQYGLW